jgi:hypothetical protein
LVDREYLRKKPPQPAPVHSRTITYTGDSTERFVGIPCDLGPISETSGGYRREEWTDIRALNRTYVSTVRCKLCLRLWHMSDVQVGRHERAHLWKRRAAKRQVYGGDATTAALPKTSHRLRDIICRPTPVDEEIGR